MKKRILIILSAIAFIFLLYVVIVRRSSPEQTERIQGKPNIPNYIGGKLPLEISVPESQVEIPSQLPTLSVNKREISFDTARQIARNIGISDNLQEFQDVSEGVKYFTNTGTHFLMITPSTATVQFGLSATEIPTVINKNLSDQEIISIATNFLTEKGFYKTEEIVAQKPVFLSKRGGNEEGFEETSKNSAQVFQVNFSFKGSEYPIVTKSTGSNQIFLRILPDGQIYYTEAALYGEVSKSTTSYALKSYGDIQSFIGEAQLVELSGDFISPVDLTVEDIVSLSVESVRIAYFLELGKENLLLPIFILEGPAVIKNSAANSATLYMPAFK
jgi:hypothetical protein